jgi:hypothetical protein
VIHPLGRRDNPGPGLGGHVDRRSEGILESRFSIKSGHTAKTRIQGGPNRRITASPRSASLATYAAKIAGNLQAKVDNTVEVERRDGQVRVHHRGRLVAAHAELSGRHGLVVLPEHGPGPAARNGRLRRATAPASTASVTALEVERRDLATYDELLAAGGAR